MNQITLKPLPILGLALALVLALPGAAVAAKGGTPGPPTGGETANNLSLPGVQIESSTSTDHYWYVPSEPTLGTHYSYGCGLEQTVGIFSYPNTTCALLDDQGVAVYYMTADECVYGGEHQGVLFAAPCPDPDYPLSRIYWQKVDVNDWWADDEGLAGYAAEVAYVDWGDALEASTFTTKSKLRVETQPYSSTILGFDPSVATCDEAATTPETDCKVGFQMWHVSGQGITEHWGVRATEEGVSYNYDSPFQIIKTSTARLNITKMAPGEAECPQPGGGDEEGEEAILEADPPPPVGVWTGSGWEGTCQLDDKEYSVETSVGGKYVYGYNLDMRAADMPTDCPGTEVWKKAGYWRLTFYTAGGLDGKVQFLEPPAPNVAPPASPAAARDLPRTAFNTAYAPVPEPADDDRLYVPMVDTANNLTYLDICIVLKEQGGGGGGKKPR